MEPQVGHGFPYDEFLNELLIISGHRSTDVPGTPSTIRRDFIFFSHENQKRSGEIFMIANASTDGITVVRHSTPRVHQQYDIVL